MRRRRSFWAAVVVSLVLLGGGATVAVRDYEHTAGPGGAVRGYYEALMRSDAPRALAFGTVPAGPHALLTSTVLRAQQRLAPMTDLSIGRVTRQGSKAAVAVSYRLGFAGDEQSVTDSVAVADSGGSWRLVRAAVPTQLSVVRAAQRATVAGGAIPEGTTLLFPGAVPIAFDSPYLQLPPEHASVDFGAGPTTVLEPEVSAAGKRAVVAATTAALHACLAATTPADTCPLPAGRYVPGSIRGALVGSPARELDAAVATGATGALTITGDVAARASYRRLTFENRTQTGTGRVTLLVRATCYAVAPLRITWTSG